MTWIRKIGYSLMGAGIGFIVWLVLWFAPQFSRELYPAHAFIVNVR